MNPRTVTALLDLNRRFYDVHADDFDATRGRAWPGWSRVVDHLTSNRPRRLDVLDAGCGNGRFGEYLAGIWEAPIHYLGLDASSRLLSAAKRKCHHFDTCEFHAVDLVEDDPTVLLGQRTFDFIALFAVLHHLPGVSNRRRVIRQLSQRLSPGGFLALTIWRLDQTPNFARKTVPWSRYNPPADTDVSTELGAVDPTDLDPGDHLLSWRGRSDPPRYCHFPGDDEIESWITTSQLELCDRFESDGPSGRDNLYLVMSRER